MNCEQFLEWTVECDPTGLEKIPDEIKLHSSNCPECATILNKLISLKKLSSSLNPTFEEVQAGTNKIIQETRSLISNQDISLVQNSQSLVFSRFLISAFSMVVIALGIYLTFFRSSENTPLKNPLPVELTQASNAQFAELTSFAGKRNLDPAKIETLQKNDIIRLGENGKISLSFISGGNETGKVEIAGTGQMLTGFRGIKVQSGNFQIRCFPSEKKFLVELPSGLLLTKGAEMTLKLESNTWNLAVSNGEVEVRTLIPKLSVTILKAGQNLTGEVKQIPENTSETSTLTSEPTYSTSTDTDEKVIIPEYRNQLPSEAVIAE
ncbi:MAG: hypothetical protein HQM10_12585 [Candidatus Riflebacteria bacterium]|nr:hypothetical protein [Candidatus Riflebacteria bacterium]